MEPVYLFIYLFIYYCFGLYCVVLYPDHYHVCIRHVHVPDANVATRAQIIFIRGTCLYVATPLELEEARCLHIAFQVPLLLPTNKNVRACKENMYIHYLCSFMYDYVASNWTSMSVSKSAGSGQSACPERTRLSDGCNKALQFAHVGAHYRLSLSLTTNIRDLFYM